MKVLGSLIIPILFFIISQTIVAVINMWVDKKTNKSNLWAKRLTRFLSIDGPLRPIIILFFLETYLDLLIGGLINTENAYLFNVSKNWGKNGYLSFGD